MHFKPLKDALLSVMPHVWHHSAGGKGDQYIVWAEDGAGDTFEADNHCEEQVICGSVDYFSRVENDPYVEDIQASLSSADISWRLSSIQFELDSKYTHYEWRWEMTAWHA